MQPSGIIQKKIFSATERQDLAESLSTPGAETVPPSGKPEDFNEIPDFLRRQPPGSTEG